MKENFIKVYIQPRSSKNEIVGPHRDGIKIRLTSPPIEGKANYHLIQFLSKKLDLSPSKIEILKGYNSREKILKISSEIDLGEILEKIKLNY